jgi:hypothetical protein
MFYQNFDTNITAKYGVVIENWPLEKFSSPSDIGSRNEIRVLLQAWESGTTRFRKLSDEELTQWEDAQFQEAMGQMVGGGGTADSELEHAVATAQTPTSQSDSFRAFANNVAEPAVTTNISVSNANSLDTATSPTMAASTSTASASKRPLPMDSSSNKRARVAPLDNFINTISSADGRSMQAPKKARKTRSDKGTKKGSRKAKDKENIASTSEATGSADN